MESPSGEEGIFSGQIVRDHISATIIKAVDVIMPAVLGPPVGYEAIVRLRDGCKPKGPIYRA